MNPRLVACFGLMVLSLMGCKERRSDVYCIAFRYGHADAGSPALGSPFEDTLGGGEIGRSDVIMAPHIFIATKDGATMSHLTHQFWDEPVREVQDGGSAFIVGSNGEQHPIVWKRVGEERRLRYGFAGRRCVRWDLPAGCDRAVDEYMIMDMRCGPTMQWLQQQPE